MQKLAQAISREHWHNPRLGQEKRQALEDIALEGEELEGAMFLKSDGLGGERPLQLFEPLGKW